MSTLFRIIALLHALAAPKPATVSPHLPPCASFAKPGTTIIMPAPASYYRPGQASTGRLGVVVRVELCEERP